LKTAGRIPNNEGIITCILTQFPPKFSMLDVLHDVLPFVSAATSRLCLEFARQQIAETTALIHLRCFDKENRIECEDVFSLELYSNNEFHYSDLWRNIPIEYSSAKIEDQQKKRGEG
ncbi:hypothetical protein PFISCL1PPCAC_25512, partial [Pristionchus fissidentatus]